MIHAHVDTAEHRKILGFETGTRAQFDIQHGGDPLWFFLDSYRVKYRADFQYFLKYPWHYIIDEYGDIHLSDEPPIIDIEVIPEVPDGYILLIGRDGRYLRGEDGEYLYGYDGDYEPPPEGMLYLQDPDGAFLKDQDQRYLIEPEGEVDPNMFLTDLNGDLLTDLDGDLITE